MSLFEYNGELLEYACYRYNTTWANERKVEIPIAREFIKDVNRFYEIGCVLPYYGHHFHVVIDKFDAHPQATNVDFANYEPKIKALKAVSISTFEHFYFNGDYGETMESPEKTIEQIKRLDTFAKKWMITIPIGYNPILDQSIKDNREHFEKIDYMRKIDHLEWEQVEEEDTLEIKYNEPHKYGNGVMVVYGGQG